MSAPTTTAAEIVRTLPDWSDWEALDGWFSGERRALEALRASPEIVASLRAVDVARVLGPPRPPFGRYADPSFRRLALAAFVADWASYPAPVDQVSFERLLHAMSVFPAGFRVWWARDAEARWLPVGYSGWHPISSAAFDLLESPGKALRDRSILPLSEATGFLYLFNYSIVEPLRGTSCSGQLLRALAGDLQATPHRGLAAITVSAAGVRVAERFGMARRGTLLIDGAEEGIYTARQPG